MHSEEQLLHADARLFEEDQRAEAVPTALQEILRAGAHHARVQVLLAEGDLVTALPRAAARRGHSFSPVAASREFLSAELSAKVGRKHRVHLEGRFIVLAHPSVELVWLVITYDSTEFERRVLDRLLSSARPRATRPLLRSDQMEAAFKALSASSVARNLRLREVGSRTRIQSEGAAKAVEADRRWTDVQLAEAFEEARESGQWVVDATGAYDVGDVHDATLKLSRRGIVTFRKHVESVFWPIVDLVSKYGAERYRFLRDRESAPQNHFESRPFKIAFRQPALETKEQIERLASVLGSIPHVTFTPLHGNPYFHAAMLDYRDGSSYEIYVLTDSHLTVVPQGRSTVQALQRLCACIFSDFREGALEDLSD